MGKVTTFDHYGNESPSDLAGRERERDPRRNLGRAHPGGPFKTPTRDRHLGLGRFAL